VPVSSSSTTGREDQGLDRGAEDLFHRQRHQRGKAAVAVLDGAAGVGDRRAFDHRLDHDAVRRLGFLDAIGFFPAAGRRRVAGGGFVCAGFTRHRVVRD
jgi:hypothetical protein